MKLYLAVVVLIVLAVLVGGWWGAVLSSLLGGALIAWSARGGIQPAGRALESAGVARERDRLEMVLAATLEGVIALDRKGKVTLMNAAAQGLLDVPRADCTGRALEEICKSPALARLASQAMLDDQLCSAELNHDSKLLQVYATPLAALTGVVLVIHDITEVRRLESVRRDFVANVSHELKTPLTSIRAYVETLIDGGLNDTDNNMRFLQKIEAHVNRLAALITDLLSLSRIESGQAISQHSLLNALEPLLEAYQRLAPTAEAKGLAMQIHVPKQRLEVLGDMEALQQIFDNLIDNAIKYTEPGGSVHITALSEGAHVRIDVKDTGVGIPREDLPRIFERFYRVDKARSRELGGTGLGLSIVKHYVQALDGEVFVESEAGAGTTFKLKFPRA